jgi:hypothetical protein
MRVCDPFSFSWKNGSASAGNRPCSMRVCDPFPGKMDHAACKVDEQWRAGGYRPVRTYLRRSSRLEARPPTCGTSQPNAYVASGAGATLKCGTCPGAAVDGSPFGQVRFRPATTLGVGAAHASNRRGRFRHERGPKRT